jgi:5-methylcytosine-specific restriction endonuclease McrA
MRWVYLEHKVRALLHDTKAWTTDPPSLKSLNVPTVWDIPMDVQFEVFRRDQFSCRYCGTKNQELEIDFRVPPEDGGSLEADNLITACVECKNKALIARARTKKK